MAIKLFSSLKKGGVGSGNLPQGITAARVQYLVLDEKTNKEAWKRANGYAGVGAIYYQSVNLPNPSKDPLAFKVAYPLFPNNKVFPLKNEIFMVRKMHFKSKFHRESKLILKLTDFPFEKMMKRASYKEHAHICSF